MQEPPIKPVPGPVDTASELVVGTRHDQAIPILVHAAVLDEILIYSSRDLRRELGGFLLGGVYRDEHRQGEQRYVEVRHFVPAVDAYSQVASLTFTHETWSQLHRQLENDFPDEVLVGWQHTHPNLGVFLSGYDLFIHRHFFRHPWQIALVLDPVRCEFAFFQWRDGKVVDCGFTCLPDPENAASELRAGNSAP